MIDELKKGLPKCEIEDNKGLYCFKNDFCKDNKNHICIINADNKNISYNFIARVIEYRLNV